MEQAGRQPGSLAKQERSIYLSAGLFYFFNFSRLPDFNSRHALASEYDAFGFLVSRLHVCLSFKRERESSQSQLEPNHGDFNSF